jgi:hypothetical protein
MWGAECLVAFVPQFVACRLIVQPPGSYIAPTLLATRPKIKEQN